MFRFTIRDVLWLTVVVAVVVTWLIDRWGSKTTTTDSVGASRQGSVGHASEPWLASDVARKRKPI